LQQAEQHEKSEQVSIERHKHIKHMLSQNNNHNNNYNNYKKHVRNMQTIKAKLIRVNHKRCANGSEISTNMRRENKVRGPQFKDSHSRSDSLDNFPLTGAF